MNTATLNTPESATFSEMADNSADRVFSPIVRLMLGFVLNAAMAAPDTAARVHHIPLVTIGSPCPYSAFSCASAT